MLNPTEELLYAILPKNKIVDIMITAFEGGSNYWLEVPIAEVDKAHAFSMIPSNIEEAKQFGMQPWASSGDFFSTSEALAIYAMKSPLTIVEYGTDEPLPNLFLSSENLIKAIKTMAEEEPVHLQNLLGDVGDAETADVFVQYIVFGKIIYG